MTKFPLAVVLVLVGTILCGVAAVLSYLGPPSPSRVSLALGFAGATLIGVGVLLG